MAELDILNAELTGDPLGRGYARMTHEEASLDLNAPIRSGTRVVTVFEIVSYLITQVDGSGLQRRSSLDMVREFAEQGTVRGLVPSVIPPTSLDARRSACRAIWFMLSRVGAESLSFPVADPNVRDLFISIGPDNSSGPSVLQNAQLAAIDGLASESLSRGIEIGFGVVEARDVRWARGVTG